MQVSVRLGRFMGRNGVLPTTQLAYRKALGTSDALLCVSHTLQSALESGQQDRIVQIDFSAALIGLIITPFTMCSALWVLEVLFLFLSLGSFLNSCIYSTAKSKTPPYETFSPPLNGTDHGSQPSLTTRDRELASVLEVIIEPGDLNQRPLTTLSVALPTIPRAILVVNTDPVSVKRITAFMVDGCWSKLVDVVSGVPQSSVLANYCSSCSCFGQLLFFGVFFHSGK